MTEKENLEEQNKNEIPEPSSSLALELIVFIHKIYLYIYNIILLGLFMFKRYAFDYPNKTIIYEVIIGIVALIINIFRLRLISVGNKTERALILLFALILGIVNFVGYIFFAVIQKYRTYFDVVFSSIGLVLTFLEIVFCIYTMFNIKVHEKSD